jgi:uncharacterized SAM-binding protein YcdF (DUF218 family)
MTSLTYLEPGLPIIFVLLAIGIRARSRRILGAATVFLFLWSWEPTAAFLSGTLEWRYPIRPFPPGDAEAIVVLSGGIYKHNDTRPEDQPKADTYGRASHAAWLYRNWKPLPIVASGGETGNRTKVVLADVMRRVLEEKGVPASMIWVEGRSRSTYENAVYSTELLRAKGITRIALVTEANHMLRAERSFRRQGLTVIPAPCAYRYVEFTGEFEQFIPNQRAIERNELALHEWLGYLWYRLRAKA